MYYQQYLFENMEEISTNVVNELKWLSDAKTDNE